MRTTILGWFCLLILVLPMQAQTKSSPKKRPTPSPAQLNWHATNFYLFFHFGPNTFTDQEWGHGTEPEDIFNPTAIDCDQWCRIALQAGAKGVVITAKHHDGFCLWPSQYSKHTVRESKWMHGKGDVIRMLRDACQRNGLKFGVYLSPWDRNHPKYGTPAYNDVYANTLTELLTSYGDLFEIWWDGANGEGPNGKKQVYDFHRFEKIAAQYQPNAVVFSDIGPGCRWAGNENGTVNETNWCMLDTAGFARGLGAPDGSVLQTGQENGALWLPAECDVSIRPGWFYHAEEDDKVKTPDQLFDIYLKSVGHGANLILNVPPDRSGRIHAQDSAALVAFGAKLRHTFAHDLAQGHKILWSHKASEQTGMLDLGKVQTFSTLVLKENIAKGQTIQSFVVEIWKSGKWKEIARSTTVGNKKILQIAAVQARKIRVRLKTTQAGNSTALKSLELFD